MHSATSSSTSSSRASSAGGAQQGCRSLASVPGGCLDCLASTPSYQTSGVDANLPAISSDEEVVTPPPSQYCTSVRRSQADNEDTWALALTPRKTKKLKIYGSELCTELGLPEGSLDSFIGMRDPILEYIFHMLLHIKAHLITKESTQQLGKYKEFLESADFKAVMTDRAIVCIISPNISAYVTEMSKQTMIFIKANPTIFKVPPGVFEDPELYELLGSIVQTKLASARSNLKGKRWCLQIYYLINGGEKNMPLSAMYSTTPDSDLPVEIISWIHEMVQVEESNEGTVGLHDASQEDDQGQNVEDSGNDHTGNHTRDNGNYFTENDGPLNQDATKRDGDEHEPFVLTEAGQTENSDGVKKKKDDDWRQFQCSGKYWNFVDYHLQKIEVKARKNAKTQAEYQYCECERNGSNPILVFPADGTPIETMSWCTMVTVGAIVGFAIFWQYGALLRTPSWYLRRVLDEVSDWGVVGSSFPRSRRVWAFGTGRGGDDGGDSGFGFDPMERGLEWLNSCKIGLVGTVGIYFSSDGMGVGRWVIMWDRRDKPGGGVLVQLSRSILVRASFSNVLPPDSKYSFAESICPFEELILKRRSKNSKTNFSIRSARQILKS
ncbi:hypothetical protein SERLA73DRAFT_157713 [Serpula lacrymans var. lacrymans S7.3]|uniref:Uncharacterized protein n=1 Tax=Serpula lacrymans var. lacrymans (strain S7.3) TaxID=936435 RepID=F8PFF1_SERL3|nr:hypothetical protein SERLA73DRAFT_157713 [Serpula lacrymans var. lacrymans S7.3]